TTSAELIYLDDAVFQINEVESVECFASEERRVKSEESKLPSTPNCNSYFSLFTLHSSLKKIAAVFLAAAFLGVLSFAGYRAFSFKTTTDYRQRTTDTLTVKSQRFVYEVHEGDTIFRFENIRLDSILAVVSRHYGRQVVFRDKAPARLRLYMTCHTTQSLDEFVEMLNMFEGFKLSQKFDTLFVNSDEKKEGVK
ncbi:MAG: DUF4974 domain-containing protein, partial [Bacteroidaceae bacterium]|nr:DUF4974 domain-containing protein [Bacteroidaceae bacterium]